MKTSSTLAVESLSAGLLRAHPKTEIPTDSQSLTPRPCAGFVVRRAPLLRDGIGLAPRYLALVLEVGFVADDDDGHFLPVLDAQDLFPQSGEL